MRLQWSRVNQAWIATLGDTTVGIGPDNRRIFASIQEFNDYCRATGTKLAAMARGGGGRGPHDAAIVTI